MFKNLFYPHKLAGVLLLLFTSCSTQPQRPTDRIMFGLNMPVKSYIRYSYADIVQVNGQWFPKESSKYKFFIGYYYNIEGNLDSLVYRSGSSGVKYTVRYNYEQGKAGMMYGEDIYFEEQHTFTWHDNYHYTQRCTDRNGNLSLQIKIWLSKTFREEKGESIGYDKQGNIISHTTGMFTFDKRGWLHRYTEEDKLATTTKVSTYVYRAYDSKGVPTHSEVYENDAAEPAKVNLATLTYYDSPTGH